VKLSHNLSNLTGNIKRIKIVKVLKTPEESLIGQTITVCGWVRSLRSQKTTTFINVNDGSSLEGLQGVMDSETSDAITCGTTLDDLTVGCSVELTGSVAKSLGKGQKFDLVVSEMKVIGKCPVDTYPLQRKHKPSPEHLRTIAHLRPRTPTIGAITRLRSQLAHATHNYFQSEGHLFVHTPILTASDCEGAGEMFRVTTLPIDDPKKIPVGSIRVTTPPIDDPKKIPVGSITGPDSVQGSDSNQPTASPSDQASQTNFREDFFHKPTYLTVSGQLSAEAYACALSDVYTFGPTFRAEKSDTARHLAEFYMVEPEMSFCDLHGAMDSAEGYVKHAILHAFVHCPDEMAFFQRFYDSALNERLQKYLPTTGVLDEAPESEAATWGQPFVRISYREAVALLQEEMRKPGKQTVKWQFPNLQLGDDLQTEHERWLATAKFDNSCVFVYDYPRKVKSFYMRDNDADDGETVHSFDLLVPRVGELVGGSQREERLDRLHAKIVELGLKPEDYGWYLDLRRFGSVPHSGYGVGFERLLCFLSGVENVRDVIPFPRYMGKAEF